MSLIAGIASFLKGDFVKNALDFYNDRFPPNMSEGDKAAMRVLIEENSHTQAMEITELAQRTQEAFDKRTIELEGTARDLTAVPYVGALIIFLRGAFRPLFSYMTLYLDFVFFTTNTSAWTEQKVTLFIIINIMVIGFFFGERMLKNIMPLITRLLEAKQPAPAP